MTERTPEEKLLDLIEDPVMKKKTASGSVIKRPGMLVHLKTWWSSRPYLKLLEIKILSRIVAGLAGLVTLFFVYDVGAHSRQYSQRLDRMLAGEVRMSIDTAGKPLPAVDLKNLLAMAGQRNIFSFIPPRKGGVLPVQQTDDAVLSQLNDLLLVGIIWSDEAPQVMIEESKEGTTSLLNKGDGIGPFTVKDITQDSVILANDKGEWRLQ